MYFFFVFTERWPLGRQIFGYFSGVKYSGIQVDFLLIKKKSFLKKNQTFEQSCFQTQKKMCKNYD